MSSLHRRASVWSRTLESLRKRLTRANLTPHWIRHFCGLTMPFCCQSSFTFHVSRRSHAIKALAITGVEIEERSVAVSVGQGGCERLPNRSVCLHAICFPFYASPIGVTFHVCKSLLNRLSSVLASHPNLSITHCFRLSSSIPYRFHL